MILSNISTWEIYPKEIIQDADRLRHRNINHIKYLKGCKATSRYTFHLDIKYINILVNILKSYILEKFS